MHRFHRLKPLLLLLTAACLGATAACLGITAARADDALTASAQVAPATPRSTATLLITLKVAPPFHVNSNPASQSYLIPVTVTVQPPAKVAAGKPVYPPGTLKKLSFSDQPMSIYEGSVVVKVPLAIDAKAAPGTVPIAGTVHYQACNETNCFPPATANFSASLTIGKGAAAPAAGKAATTGAVHTNGTKSPTPVAVASPTATHPAVAAANTASASNAASAGVIAQAGNTATTGNTVTPAVIASGSSNAASTAVAAAGTGGSAVGSASATQAAPAPEDTHSWLGRTTDSLAQSIRGAPLWLSLVFIFIGGLLMNLTPCVYPMVPITIGYFGSQGEGSRKAAFTLSVMYVLGLAAVYSTLGVVAGLTGSLFGSMLQSPFVVGGIALIFLLLSLSMLGLFTIQPPQFLMAKSGAKKGALGALAMGALLGVVAVPCIGPVVAVLVGIVATEHSWVLGMLRFFVLSLGLGLPYLLLGAFSGAAKALPRSGAWLERSKKIFAIPILLVAFFYGGQAYATYSAPKASADARELRLKYHVVGLPDLVFIDGDGQERVDLRANENLTKQEFIEKLQALKMGAPGADKSEFAPVTSQALEDAQRDRTPIVLDFRADWCIPCRKLEKDVFSQPDVQRAAGGVKLLTVDLTNTS